MGLISSVRCPGCGSIAVVLGVAERAEERGDTLYCSRVFIHASGEIDQSGGAGAFRKDEDVSPGDVEGLPMQPHHFPHHLGEEGVHPRCVVRRPARHVLLRVWPQRRGDGLFVEETAKLAVFFGGGFSTDALLERHRDRSKGVSSATRYSRS